MQFLYLVYMDLENRQDYFIGVPRNLFEIFAPITVLSLGSLERKAFHALYRH